MYGPHYAPAPIEKIRKASWTGENTSRTQEIVDGLIEHRSALIAVTGASSSVVAAIDAAVKRFKQLDPSVK